MLPDEKNVSNPPERWLKQSSALAEIWKEYCVLAEKVIHNALKKSCKFSELYYVLSALRLECELAKGGYLSKTQPDHDNKYVFIRLNSFGLFQPGWSSELQPENSAQWGVEATRLLHERTDNHDIRQGLSCIAYHELSHPKGLILERLESLFQRLLVTENLFECLRLTSLIIYGLSNYPPITRGSAAVSAWIMDGIFRERFQMTESIKPPLYDWTAFYDSPEHYSEYFIISTVINYLNTLSCISKEKRKELCSLREMLQKNPNVSENLENRREAWRCIQDLMQEMLKNSGLNQKEKDYLSHLALGQLFFRKPSELCVELVTRYKNKLPLTAPMQERFEQLFLLNEDISEAYLQAHDNLELEEKLNIDWSDLQFLRMNNMKELKEYILPLKDNGSTFEEKNKMEAEVSQKVETELAHSASSGTGFKIIHLTKDPLTLDKKTLSEIINNHPTFAIYNSQVYFIDQDCILGEVKLSKLSYMGLIKAKDVLIDFPLDLLPEELVFSGHIRFHLRIENLRKISLASLAELAQIPFSILPLLLPIDSNDSKETKRLKKGLEDAIWSGGLRIHELSQLTIQQIHLITSPKAIAAYKRKEYILAKDIIANARLLNLDVEEKSNFQIFRSTVSLLFKPTEKGKSIQSDLSADPLSVERKERTTVNFLKVMNDQLSEYSKNDPLNRKKQIHTLLSEASGLMNDQDIYKLLYAINKILNQTSMTAGKSKVLRSLLNPALLEMLEALSISDTENLKKDFAPIVASNKSGKTR